MSVPSGEKDAARAALRAINPKSILENREYGVIVFKKRHHYDAGEPFTSGLPDGLTEADILKAKGEIPKGSTFTALCHTHGRDHVGEFVLVFSPEDIETARRFSVNAYLATPSNELVIFDRGGKPGVFPREML